MKISVSLAEEDLAILDEYVRETRLRSRSAGVQRAVRMLRHPDLEGDYEAAWREWQDSSDADLWEVTAADGLDAPR